jgi:hypothetical protein
MDLKIFKIVNIEYAHWTGFRIEIFRLELNSK